MERLVMRYAIFGLFLMAAFCLICSMYGITDELLHVKVKVQDEKTYGSLEYGSRVKVAKGFYRGCTAILREEKQAAYVSSIRCNRDSFAGEVSKQDLVFRF